MTISDPALEAQVQRIERALRVPPCRCAACAGRQVMLQYADALAALKAYDEQ